MGSKLMQSALPLGRSSLRPQSRSVSSGEGPHTFEIASELLRRPPGCKESSTRTSFTRTTRGSLRGSAGHRPSSSSAQLLVASTLYLHLVGRRQSIPCTPGAGSHQPANELLGRLRLHPPMATRMRCHLPRCSSIVSSRHSRPRNTMRISRSSPSA